MKNRSRLLPAVLLLWGCTESDMVAPPAERPLLDRNQAPVVVDMTPRRLPSSEQVLADLRNRSVSDGTVLIGLKEAAAVRGVDSRGGSLPVAAREHALREIRAAFPDMTVIGGIHRQVPSPGGVNDQLVAVTWIRAELPLSIGRLSALQRHPNVDYVIPNYTNGESYLEATPWGVTKTRAPTVWSMGWTGGASGEVGIAILDTGLDMSDPEHGDFNVAWFWDLVGDEPGNPCTSWSQSCKYEQVYHGTGVAGLAAGLDNDYGSLGASQGHPGAVYIYKLHYRDTTDSIRTPIDDFATAVMAAGNPGSLVRARVGVTSLGYNGTHDYDLPVLRDAFAHSYYEDDVIWFAAAGNTYGGPVTIPGAYPEVIAVGSVESNLTRSGFSPYDDEIELVAPGGMQWLSWNRNDDSWYVPGASQRQGTSFAAPIAAGIARIARHRFPLENAQQIRARMQTYAKDLGAVGRDNSFGYGFVDAYCVVMQVQPCT